MDELIFEIIRKYTGPKIARVHMKSSVEVVAYTARCPELLQSCCCSGSVGTVPKVESRGRPACSKTLVCDRKRWTQQCHPQKPVGGIYGSFKAPQ